MGSMFREAPKPESSENAVWMQWSDSRYDRSYTRQEYQRFNTVSMHNYNTMPLKKRYQLSLTEKPVTAKTYREKKQKIDKHKTCKKCKKSLQIQTNGC